MPHVYSTMSNDNIYPTWIKGTGARPAVGEDRVLIAGKANVINDRTLVTPRGAVTTVTVEQLELLMKNKHFVAHMERGFITVDAKSRNAEDAAEVAKDMTAKDASAQLVESDFTKKVVTPATAEVKKAVKVGSKAAIKVDETAAKAVNLAMSKVGTALDK